jgi:GDP-L-fucose synthase
MLNKNSKIYIAGHKGMVGSACWKVFLKSGYQNLIGKSFDNLDLRNQMEVEQFIKNEKPDLIIDAAAKVGGILANDTYPYDFLVDNLSIQNNLITSAHNNNIKKFIFLGSSCIYPKLAPQPLEEKHLLTGTLEPTNQWYALAKITGVKLIESLRIQHKREYFSLMPTNLYGYNDNFDLNNSHVLPALIRKFHESKINRTNVTLWGTGEVYREFLFVDDLANAVLLTSENNVNEYLYNVGSQEELTIKDLSIIIKKIVGYKGNIIWDETKPNGTPRKIMNSDKIRKLGWKPKTSLLEGIQKTYDWYLKSLKK